MASGTDGERSGLWLSIPDGYIALPLANVSETIATSRQVVAELGPPTRRAANDHVLDLMDFSLRALAERGGVYCGIGQHRSLIDDQVITSSLVVTVLEFPQERNPRLVLRDLLLAKANAGEVGQPDLVDLPNGPSLFFEQTRTLPRPAPPGEHVLAESSESAVWQLEAFVPSPEGDKLATIEVSTPFVAQGPQYRAMAVTLAGTVAFRPPIGHDQLSALLG